MIDELLNIRIKPRSALRNFINSEAAGGIVLMIVAALALIIANSPWADIYFHAIHAETGPVLTPKLGPMTVHLWINDALMAVFFLLVGLEIKREFVDGHLASWPDRVLPMIAAAAGMIVPALVYLFIAGGDPDLVRGWAIPAATDIAFAIGVLALLGSRAPASLKLFLTTVAIVDDMGAVVIIALFYTASLNMWALLAAVLIWLAMMALNRFNVVRLWPYLLLAVALWFAVLLSGVHATIAGVLAAFAIPFRRTLAAPDAEDSALHRLEHAPGCVRDCAAIRLCQCRRVAERSRPRSIARAVAAWDRRRIVPWQAGRYLHQRLCLREIGYRCPPARCELGAGLWRGAALRGGLYDEPVYRRAGL
jgi:Na+:H+ antiporter, NhaA family